MSDSADTPADTDATTDATDAGATTTVLEVPAGLRRSGAASFGGGIWFIGWMLTIGYADLGFWKAVLAFFVWPYYLGEALRLAMLS